MDTTFWNERLEDINNLEKHLARNGTVIVKFFLNLSHDEQKCRLLRRLEHPEKNWKYDPSDLIERGYWNEYTEAFEAALTATSTQYAPWFVVPADHKWVMRALVASIIAEHLGSMDLRYPEPDAAARKLMKQAFAELNAEAGDGDKKTKNNKNKKKRS